MHILQLANFYSPTSGGLRTALDALGREYASAGHRRTLVVPGPVDSVTEDDAGTIVNVRSPRVPGLDGYRVIVRPTAVDRIVVGAAPDVIELSDKSTLVPCARRARDAGVPVAVFSHERLDAVFAAAVAQRRLVARATAAYTRRLGGAADAIVCASRFAAAEFADLPPSKLHIVPLGVDHECFAPRHDDGFARRAALELVSVVRLSADKRPEILVETSEVLTARGIDHHLTVYGDGPMRAALERRAVALPVTFAGFVADRRRLAAAMSRADVGMSPGPAETFGLAALEMMACGTPVVVPDQGSLPEVVGDGGLVARRTAHGFAEAVLRLAASDAVDRRRRALGRAAEFTWARTAADLLELYGTLARPSDPQPARSNL